MNSSQVYQENHHCWEMIVLSVTAECFSWKGWLQKGSCSTGHASDVINAKPAFDLEHIITFLIPRSSAVYLIAQEVLKLQFYYQNNFDTKIL